MFLKNKKAETSVSLALKVVISVVIGGLLLTGVYFIINSVAYPEMAETIETQNLIRTGELGLDVNDEDNPLLNHSGIVPVGGVYQQGSNTYEEGQRFPEIESGDIYTFGDYTYEYKTAYGEEHIGKGWKVAAIDKTKSSYGFILEFINYEPVTFLDNTFEECRQMETSPIIPKTAQTMCNTFLSCVKLKEAPIIPSGVTDITKVFFNCTYLSTYPGNVDGIGNFSNYKIPANVRNTSQAFMWCCVITYAPDLPQDVWEASGMFANCQSLEVGPKNLQHITIMDGMFSCCSKLTSVGPIPSNARDMITTFFGCSSLKTVEINANPSSYTRCLRGSGITEITGKTKIKDELLATK